MRESAERGRLLVGHLQPVVDRLRNFIRARTDPACLEGDVCDEALVAGTSGLLEFGERFGDVL